MGLKLSQDYKGIACEYWRISRQDEDFNNDRTEVYLSLYKSKAARDQNSNNDMGLRKVVVDKVGLTRAQCYAEIKKEEARIDDPVDNVNHFVDATDVLDK